MGSPVSDIPARVLIVGGGGREHALAVTLARSPHCAELHCSPGNAGIAAVARCHDVAATDVDGIVELARSLGIELVVIGPETALAAGLADELAARGIAAFGPTAAAAQIESSKTWAKAVMRRAGVPTAAYSTFSDAAAGPRVCRVSRRANRDQGRRPGSRQGRRRCARA